MNKREYLYEISDLTIGKTLHTMDDALFEDYCKKLQSFIDSFPALEGALKTHLNNKDYKAFFDSLAELREMLIAISANELVHELNAQTKAYTSQDKINHNRLEAFTTYFLSVAAMLSIDIQKAEYETTISAPAADTSAPPAVSGRAKTILAVDDQSVHLTSLAAHVKDTPYKLVCLTSGEDALRYIEKNSPDLFILDIMMPEMDGCELAKKIKASGQKAKIIFLTGSSSRDTIANAMRSGGTDFILKPAARENVFAKIEKYILP
jgi:CheY-like chemotaxis protein